MAAQETPKAPLPPLLREHYLRSGLWNDTSLGSLLLQGLQRHPAQRICIWTKRASREETFGSLAATALRFAAGLARRGVEPGDRVVIWLPNGWEAIAAFVGVAALGAVIVPVASFYGRKEMTDIVNAAGACVIVACDRHGNRNYLEEVGDSRPQLPSVHTVVACSQRRRDIRDSSLITFGELLGAPTASVSNSSSPDEACMLAFTSGTGGTAKGVIHTHRTLGAEVRRHLGPMTPADATPQIVASPIAHAAGMCIGLLAPIHRGDPIHTALSHRLVPGGGASVFLSALIDHPKFTDELAHRMGHVTLGGSTVPESLITKASRRGITVLRCYGLTEQPTVSAACLDDEPSQLIRTDGRLLDGVEVQVRARSGTLLRPGTEGEIFTRGPDRCAGYLQPELNAAFDAEGWLATGDIGTLDTEGHLAVTDRAKDLIIRNGVNIAPAEVESALMTCDPVADVAVIGVPDTRTGERAVAVVVARDGSDVSLSDLTAHLAAMGVAKPKWPEELRVVGSLPRTASGKVRKNDLQKAWST